MKKKISLFLAAAMMLTLFAGCTPSAETTPTPTPGANPTQPAAQKDVDLVFFTGKVETVDLLDEIIAAYNAQSNGMEKSRTVQNLNTPNMKLTRPGLWRPDETSQAADHLD